jgi:hypothetical protein
MLRLQIDTYEGDDETPVISHVFYGATKAEAEAVVKAHMGTDSFFRAAMTSGNFKGIRLSNYSSWEDLGTIR